jgi:hypothetical protein
MTNHSQKSYVMGCPAHCQVLQQKDIQGVCYGLVLQIHPLSNRNYSKSLTGSLVLGKPRIPISD